MKQQILTEEDYRLDEQTEILQSLNGEVCIENLAKSIEHNNKYMVWNSCLAKDMWDLKYLVKAEDD